MSFKDKFMYLFLIRLKLAKELWIAEGSGWRRVVNKPLSLLLWFQLLLVGLFGLLPYWLIMKATRRLRAISPTQFAWILLVAGVFIGLVGYFVIERQQLLESAFLESLYPNIASEAVFLALTVLILDKLYEKKSDEDEKERLKLWMSSTNAERTEEAIHFLRRKGWLSDGSLAGIDLQEANLTSAKLWGARLPKADFTKARLDGANLQDAVLSGEFVGGSIPHVGRKGLTIIAAWTKFSGATLRYARLSGADVRYCDFSTADLTGANLENIRYNLATMWPEGFLPPASAVLVPMPTERRGVTL